MTVDLTALDAANKALQADPKAARKVKQYAAANTAAWHQAYQPPLPSPSSSAWAWDARSAAITSAVLIADLISGCVNGGVSFAASVAEATAATNSPGYTIVTTAGPQYAEFFDPQVYIPLGTVSSQGMDDDGHLSVRDPINGREHNFEHAQFVGGRWQCQMGNSFALDSATCPALGCVSAAGTPLGRLIRPADLAGPLKTLQFSMKAAAISSSAPVYPGNPALQAQTGPAANLPFGGWVRLPASVSSPPAGIDPLSGYIWRCLVGCGMILRDGESQSHATIYGANTVNQGGLAHDWAAVGVTFNLGTRAYGVALDARIPWGKLEALHPPAV